MALGTCMDCGELHTITPVRQSPLDRAVDWAPIHHEKDIHKTPDDMGPCRGIVRDCGSDYVCDTCHEAVSVDDIRSIACPGSRRPIR